MVEPTAVIRADHVNWRCNQPLDRTLRWFCRFGNPMTLVFCQECCVARYVDAEALNADWERIGELIFIDRDGVEWWQYDEVVEEEPVA